MYTMNQITIIASPALMPKLTTHRTARWLSRFPSRRRILEGCRRQLAEQNRLAPNCFFREAGRIHVNPDERFVCDGAGHGPHSRV